MAEKRVAFITGAGRGIGRAIALELAGQGFDIAGNDLVFDPGDMSKGLAEVKARVEALGAAFEPVPGDIADLETHQGLLDQTLKRFGRVDVLVNNAGIAPAKRVDILETTPESFDRVLSVNARGTFFLTQSFARHMKDRVGRDRKARPIIIFISSISAYVSSPSRAEYCMSKAAISQGARVFAHALAEHGILVHEVRPGIIRTDMIAAVEKSYEKRAREGLIPQQRLGEPEDVARAVAALAREDFNYSTGLIIETSGGMQIHRL
jgi:NAD(P)-dependent dehydrogenase (short-subunit alcohol dehydrogenase family)